MNNKLESKNNNDKKIKNNLINLKKNGNKSINLNI